MKMVELARRLTRRAFGHERMKTPDEYLQYMAGDGPKEGELTIEPGWFQLWDPRQLEKLNTDYDTQACVPDFWGFGSSGGGEMLAFDRDGAIFMIPFIPMDRKDAVKIAQSWQEFETKIVK